MGGREGGVGGGIMLKIHINGNVITFRNSYTAMHIPTLGSGQGNTCPRGSVDNGDLPGQCLGCVGDGG